MGAQGLDIPGFENPVRIGTGGSSTVFRAVDVRHQRHVAIKVLDAQAATGPRRTAFQREIEAIGRIGSHPNIVTILGSGFTAGSHPYLVLPLFERGTYGDLVDEQGPLTWAEAVDVGIKLASAVETVHRAGVVHRDIKPGNVFVGVTPEHPLLADFGISSTVGGEPTKTQTMAVTFGYTAPEVLDDERPTPASDIYSLAMTIFRLIQGLHAYYAETPAAVMRKVLGESDRPQLSAGVPDDLADVVAGALERDPAKRPPSALLFARRLQAVQRHHNLPVTAVVVADEPALPPEAATRPASTRAAAAVEPPSAQSTTEAVESSLLDALIQRAPTEVRDEPVETPEPPVATPQPPSSTRSDVDVGAILAAAIGDRASGEDANVSGGDNSRSLDLPTVVTPRQPRSALQNPAPPEPTRRRWPKILGASVLIVLVIASLLAAASFYFGVG